MNHFKTKLKKQGGFTLIEMLIVVAIIAILVAVSIPLVNTSLEKARVATDAANERAAKAAALVEFLTNDGNTGAAKITYFYDAQAGTVSKTDAPDVMYGKCKLHSGHYVKVTVDAEGNCTVAWDNTDTLDGISVDDSQPVTTASD